MMRMKPHINADEHGWLKWIAVLSVLISLHLWFLSGCTSENGKHATTRPSGVAERQDEALRDPFGYSPNMDQRDVSGGGITNYDGPAMKKDVDHVINP